jgi:hypothetical protein
MRTTDQVKTETGRKHPEMNTGRHGFEQKIAKGTKVTTSTFCQIPVGGRFEFRGRRYEKMNSEVGRDEDRGGNFFHAGTEVVQTEKVEWRGKSGQMWEIGGRRPGAEMENGRTKRTEGAGQRSEVARKRPEGWWLPKPEDRYALGEHDEAVRVAAELAYWRMPARRATRLGRETDRELRAYGTL